MGLALAGGPPAGRAEIAPLPLREGPPVGYAALGFDLFFGRTTRSTSQSSTSSRDSSWSTDFRRFV